MLLLFYPMFLLEIFMLLFYPMFTAGLKPQKAQMEEVAHKESIAIGITAEVKELQKRDQDSFTIPECFVYILHDYSGRC
jgi:hypothetical protein